MMDDLFAAASVWLAGLFPPLVSGPVAAVIFYWVVRRRERRLLVRFWFLLPLVDLAVIAWMAATMGAFIGPGELACILTPLAALVTAVILVPLRKRVPAGEEDGVDWPRAYRVGMLLIPLLQLTLLLVLMVLAPLLCEVGLRACSDW